MLEQIREIIAENLAIDVEKLQRVQISKRI